MTRGPAVNDRRREAGEPLEATGPLADPHTVVRLGARAEGAGGGA